MIVSTLIRLLCMVYLNQILMCRWFLLVAMYVVPLILTPLLLLFSFSFMIVAYLVQLIIIPSMAQVVPPLDSIVLSLFT